MAKNLAKTYGPKGVRVTCIAPGVIEKDAQNSRELARRYGVTEERARYEYVCRDFGMEVALERAGRHAEFADPITFLLSSRASYVTAAILNIDGGTDFLWNRARRAYWPAGGSHGNINNHPAANWCTVT
jgi:3-oxoacyl-[acyl-carrier protein] reductase